MPIPARQFRLQHGVLLELNESHTRWFFVTRVPETIKSVDEAISWHQQKSLDKPAPIEERREQKRVAS
jgi:hypothetical protein